MLCIQPSDTHHLWKSKCTQCSQNLRTTKQKCCASKVKCFQWNCNSINDNIIILMACIPLMFCIQPSDTHCLCTTNFAQETGYENYNGYHLWKSKPNATEPSYSKEEICFQRVAIGRTTVKSSLIPRLLGGGSQNEVVP